jgi:hypothetical protein
LNVAGYIVYEGPSRLTKENIVCIVTGVGDKKTEQTRNRKTGPQAQVWILCADVSPTQAINEGRDKDICGSCPLRGILQKNEDGTTTNRMRSCYVSVENAPRAVWQAWQDGNYEPLTDDVRWESQSTRLGAYGDPSVLPFTVCKDLISRGDGRHTGYTHSKSSQAHPMRKMLMASVHSQEEARKLHEKGWRTFRTMSAGEELMPNEFICPASEEGGKRLTCDECGACSGVGFNESRLNAASVAIYVHGSPSKMGSYKRTFNV